MNINEAIEQLKYYQNKPYVPTVRKVCDIALETIEALQQENERLNAALDKAVDMIGDNSRCPTDFNSRKCSDFENCLDCWKDWLLGGKEDV